MLKLHKINGEEIYLNPDLFERMEQNPDTRLTLINDHMYIVKESPEAVLEKIISFKSALIESRAEDITNGKASVKSFLTLKKEVENG